VLGVNVWRGMLGVDRATVIESVEEDAEGSLVARVRPRRDSKRRCGRCGVRAAGYMTVVRGGGAGERWIWGRGSASLRVRRRGWIVPSTARRWLRFRGRVMTRAIRSRLMIRRRGW